MLAIAAVAAGIAAAVAPVGAAPPPPTVRIGVPNPVHVNKAYRVKVSGYTAKRRYVALFVQAESAGKCRKQPEGEQNAGAVEIFPFPGRAVGPGTYSVKSDKLFDRKANGHDYACAYLGDASHSSWHQVARAQKRYKSKP